MDGACGMYVWDAVCRILIGKQWNKTRGRTRHEWENNIKMVLKEVRCDVDWIHVGKNRMWCWAVVNKETKFRII
jgi:hypothetical protein